jgi:iron complex transport system substrate-binding protein
MLAMAGCAPSSSIDKSQSAIPARIVSLDYCSDQFVLKLADRSQILALSKDATKEFSYMSKQAIGIPNVRSQAEDVMVLRPDLVARSYGGGPGAKGFFERAGLPIAQLDYADDYKGIIANIRSMAKAFGHPERGEALVAEFEARLAAIKKAETSPSALYTTPSGVTGGKDTMIDLMMDSASLSNFQEQEGWNPIPLERLARERPDMVIAASFGTKTNPMDGWSPSRHPVARAQIKGQTILPLNGALTSCGGWFVIEAIEAMAASGQVSQTQGVTP